AAAVLAREAALPTGLPLGLDNNVAIPHTDPEHVLKPGLAMATLCRPVAFCNMEDPEEKLQVSVVFLMALNDK
ncbi:PTS sugar transporter subunit IIA, partial [Escherichia coli]|nr:PTS sugar transporter subunit IIA [Escherichia coli]